MQQTLELVNYYAMLIWDNAYAKGVIFFLIYLILLYLILIPLARKFLIPFINKTKTNLDNELYGKNKNYFSFFLFFLGLDIVYKLYWETIPDKLIHLAFNVIITITYILVYLIVHKSSKVIFKYIVLKYKEIITENISNLLKLMIDIFTISVIVLLILNTWGVNIGPLLAGAGIFGLAVAMASKNIIENFLSGLIIFADKSFNIGDVVQLSDGTLCTITEINVRTTMLKTFDGNVIIIPNSDFLNQKILNKSLSEIADKKRVEVNVGISYGDDAEKAKELVASYLKELDGADEDSIVVFVSSLSNWSVDITGRVMVDDKKRSYLMVHSVIEKVYKDFPKHGLSFPFPTYTIDGKEIKLNNDKHL